MNHPYKFTLGPVYNRDGKRLPTFLDELIPWAQKAPDEIFAPNAVPVDIFTVIKSSLGTPIGRDKSGQMHYGWDSLDHRKAAMLEAMRVHAGFESEWNWNQGVDRTNAASQRNITGQETGLFQVSFDSTWLGEQALRPFCEARSIANVSEFIPAMKLNHELALEYYARLVRVSIAWAGPLLRHGNDSVYPWLSRTSMVELQGFLK